jgi:phage terminase large subunit-like protein
MSSPTDGPSSEVTSHFGMAKQMMSKKQAARVIEEMKFWKLLIYHPYPKIIEFHEAGADPKVLERLLKMGNQQGKTEGVAAEVAMHLTGRYPKWWNGKRYEQGIECWVAGQTFEIMKKTTQLKLMGPKHSIGTGYIPKIDIIDTEGRTGMPGAFETVYVQHQSGSISVLSFKCYKQDAIDWAGAGVDFFWGDEEPGPEHYSQAQARTLETEGVMAFSMTPEEGETELLKQFWPFPNSETRVLIEGRAEDCPHYKKNPERLQRDMERFPEWQRQMRMNGDPVRGHGMVYSVDPSVYMTDDFKIPDSYLWLGAIDFGGDHPTACLWGSVDPNSHTLYIVKDYLGERDSQNRFMLSSMHASAMRSYQPWMPWAWPHDGNRQDGSGNTRTLAQTYREPPNNINMLWEHSTFEDGVDFSVEPGIERIFSWMVSGRLKVFRSCTRLEQAILRYYRKDGKIVKKEDDLPDALRYLAMMVRHAQPIPIQPTQDTTDLQYNPYQMSNEPEEYRWNAFDRRVM